MLEIAVRPYWLKDRDGVAFLVDEDMEHLLRRKHIWTHDNIVMIEVYGALCHSGRGYRSSEDIPTAMPLARFVWETYMMMTFPLEKQIRHKDGNIRNLTFTNLEVIR